MQLAELHILAVLFKETLDNSQTAVRGKTEMTDTPILLLLHEVGIGAVLFLVQIGVDIHFANIVEEIEIEIIDSALLQLLFENLFDPAEIGKVVPGEFTREIKTFARILG